MNIMLPRVDHDCSEMVERLERLKRQIDLAMLLVKTGEVRYHTQFTLPDTMMIGDFVIIDRSLTTQPT